MKCPKCGNELTEYEEGHYVCASCGSRFRKKTPAPAPTPVETKTPEQKRIEELESQLAALREKERIQELERQIAEAQSRINGEQPTTDLKKEPNSTTTKSTVNLSEPLFRRKGDKTIYFGSYPQSEVKSRSIIDALTSAAGELPTASNPQKWTSYKYYIEGKNDVDFMWFIDLDHKGARYRGVYFTSYRPKWTKGPADKEESIQYRNGYEQGYVYWFKFEPIEWRILDQSTDTAFLMSEKALDAQAYVNRYSEKEGFVYNEEEGTPNGITANNYLYSWIRSWLNNEFYRTAFDDRQKGAIVLTTVDNSARSTNPDAFPTKYNKGKNDNACEDTEDYVYLISYQEAMRKEYKFNSTNINKDDRKRRLQTTDYMKAQGGYFCVDIPGCEGGADWWFRSPYPGKGEFSASIMGADAEGHSFRRATAYYVFYGVVPAIRLKLN
ncbi:MAG: hypothetical protein J5765_04235 [Clostridia bacterium]|nr:hypothetical protein [Clostridia bacterium]